MKSDRSPLLDCIRTVAIMMVLIFHVATRYEPETLDAVAAWFLRFGFLGVDIFFPLSGFLISRFLLAGDRPGFVRVFFLRRFFRIVPLYFAAVALYAAATLVTGHERELLDRIWINATFLTGWMIFFEGRETIPYTITWSLSVEEFAYILFGLCVALSARNFVRFLILLAILPALLRFWLLAGGYAEPVDIYHFPLTRLDSIALGGLTAYGVARWGVWTLPALLVGLALSVGVAYLGSAAFNVAIYIGIALATCAVMVVFETWLKDRRGPALAAAAQIGFYSYFIYLFHFFVIYGLFAVIAALALPTPSFWLMCAAVTLLTSAAAFFSYHLFERPLMQFGRRLEPGIVAAAAAHPPRAASRTR